MRVSSEKRLLVLLGILVATVVSGWLFRSTSEPPSIFLPPELPHEPDYYLKNFVATTMDVDGKPRRRLAADSMVHFPDDDSATLDRPRLELFTEHGRTWEISSTSGQVNPGGESIDLHGEVRISAVDGETESDRVEMLTSEMVVWPERQYAETESPVKIKFVGGVVDAVGMHADFKQRRMELQAEVRGIYEPVDH
jgi:lipopolysaccharide export system protein LptC